MNNISVSIAGVQHIESLSFDVDLARPGIICVVGRNGVGKTTLVRAFKNLSSADTFLKTAGSRIFSKNSRITYKVDNSDLKFTFDESISSINCKDDIPERIKRAVSAELSMPHGARFHYHHAASEADSDIRKAVALGFHVQPVELVAFLNEIYGVERYSLLVEIVSRGKPVYVLLRDDGTYIREDYLSSGEYFLINLYRTIRGDARLVVVDEIDLSLDAAAQAKLAPWLRKFCGKYNVVVVFTTHSLAMMRSLGAEELFYMHDDAGAVSISPASYAYVNARLFGFVGWDRYILTEDEVLAEYVEYLVEVACGPLHFSYKTIYIGGASQVVDLLVRNETDGFLAPAEAVIAILDGDQEGERHAARDRVYLAPVQSVEKDFYLAFSTDQAFPFTIQRRSFTSAKDFFRYVQDKQIATRREIYSYLTEFKKAEALKLVSVIAPFLGAAPRSGWTCPDHLLANPKASPFALIGRWLRRVFKNGNVR